MIKLIAPVALILSFILQVLIFPNSATAISIYDDNYHTTDELILWNSSDDTHYPISLQEVGAILAGSPPPPFVAGSMPTNIDDYLDDVINFDEQTDSMSITQYFSGTGYPGGKPFIVICFAKNSQMQLNWNSSQVLISGEDWCLYYDSNTTLGRVNVRPSGSPNLGIGMLRIISTKPSGTNARENMFCQNCDPNYPADYEGAPVIDVFTPSGPPEVIRPEYSWSLKTDDNDNGILNVKYLGNLPHFLTGTSYLVVEKMTDDWDALDENLGSMSAQPGGWADWNFNIGVDPGYYMFRIDHNQQLDSPPWPADHNYSIGQVYYQFFWDGHSAIAGSTVGCGNEICNQFTDGDNYMQRYLHALQLNSYGLTAIVTAPLAFIAGLPAAGANCTPIVLPAPYIGNINLPCMKSYYEEHFSVPLAIYQASVTAMFVYFVSLGIFARIKDITNPKDDSIEAVKL